MKIKRYTAVSMRAALAQVRAEQGPDAVILSSRRGEDGIEVIAAVDYDEALFADANRQRPAPIIAPAAPKAPIASTAPRTATPAPAPASMPRPTPPAAPAMAQRAPQRSAAPDMGYGAMQRELQDLRRVVETGLAGMTWSDKRLREPLQARVLEELSAMDIAPDVAMALAALTPRRTSLENPSHIPLALLAKHLPIVNDPTCVTGGITAVVGPTGAGKTTTIAKLAARWCMQHGSQDLALVSTDGYRIGAREQLMTYARILGAPMHAANGAQELLRVLERLKSKKLILIDTAG
ncbi:MAG: flagellar biosynthesis protein FlhF, partial [Gammaproteobacteria bacterium]|nr:flagellar biosynthesis protein FlhF [Gammaproteobacteria bacterium]